MALARIIKNVYTFANILSQAGTEVAQFWDLKSLENAFNWAKYCEKIEEQTREKAYRGQLNQQLQSLTLCLTPVTLLDLSLERLGQAKLYLSKILIENACISDNLKKAVLKELAEANDSDRNDLVKKVLKSTDVQSRSEALLPLLGGALCGQDSSETHAGIIINSLARLRKSSNITQRYNRFFEEFFEKLTNTSTGWEILLNVLLTDIDDEDDHWYQEDIKEEILQWIIRQNKLTCGLWKTKKDLICEVCSRDDQFCNLYKEHVLLWGKSMEPIYGLTKGGDLYHWCFHGKEQKDQWCYRSLVEHVLGLIEQDKYKRWNFETHITDLSKQSHFNIWKDILQSVKERLRY